MTSCLKSQPLSFPAKYISKEECGKEEKSRKETELCNGMLNAAKGSVLKSLLILSSLFHVPHGGKFLRSKDPCNALLSALTGTCSGELPQKAVWLHPFCHSSSSLSFPSSNVFLTKWAGGEGFVSGNKGF